jgi:hypothetical protein
VIDLWTKPLRLDLNDPVTAEALRIWQERERRFPFRIQRLHPDSMDGITGAWGKMVSQARENLNRT